MTTTSASLRCSRSAPSMATEKDRLSTPTIEESWPGCEGSSGSETASTTSACMPCTVAVGRFSSTPPSTYSWPFNSKGWKTPGSETEARIASGSEPRAKVTESAVVRSVERQRSGMGRM